MRRAAIVDLCAPTDLAQIRDRSTEEAKQLDAAISKLNEQKARLKKSIAEMDQIERMTQ